MFGFIKNLIAGIIGFITGLFSGKKGGGYYLELKEEAADSAASVKKEVIATKPAAPAPAPVAPTPAQPKPSKPEPLKAPAAATETNFATKYLVPSAGTSNGRRLPGPNMNSYLDMARQVKTQPSA
jgi:hypothetical protein